MAGVQCPGFTSVQQCAELAGLIDLHLGVGGQHGIVPYSCCKAAHCCLGLANPGVELGVQGEVAGDGGAKVDKFIHHFRCVVADGDVWSTADILPHDVGLLETDCEAKLPTCACEPSDESL